MFNKFKQSGYIMIRTVVMNGNDALYFIGVSFLYASLLSHTPLSLDCTVFGTSELHPQKEMISPQNTGFVQNVDLRFQDIPLITVVVHNAAEILKI